MKPSSSPLNRALALLGAVVDKALGQKQGFGGFAELRTQGAGMNQPGFGPVMGRRGNGFVTLRHVTSIVTTIENGHKKTGLEKFSKRPGSHVSPACLATYLTWLQAGRLKSPRDKLCSYSVVPFPSRRPSVNRIKGTNSSVSAW